MEFNLVAAKHAYSAVNVVNDIIQCGKEFGFCPFNEDPTEWCPYNTFTTGDYNDAINETIPMIEKMYKRDLTDFEIAKKVGTYDIGPCSAKVLMNMVRKKGFSLRILWKPQLLLLQSKSSPDIFEDDILAFGDAAVGQRYMDINVFPLCHASGMPLIYFVRECAKAQVGYFVASTMLDSVDEEIVNFLEKDNMVVSVYEISPANLISERIRAHETQNAEALLHIKNVVGCKRKDLSMNVINNIYDGYRQSCISRFLVKHYEDKEAFQYSHYPTVNITCIWKIRSRNY